MTDSDTNKPTETLSIIDRIHALLSELETGPVDDNDIANMKTVRAKADGIIKTHTTSKAEAVMSAKDLARVQLVEAIKANPDACNYPLIDIRTFGRLTVELIKNAAGIDREPVIGDLLPFYLNKTIFDIPKVHSDTSRGLISRSSYFPFHKKKLLTSHQEVEVRKILRRFGFKANKLTWKSVVSKSRFWSRSR